MGYSRYLICIVGICSVMILRLRLEASEPQEKLPNLSLVRSGWHGCRDELHDRSRSVSPE